MIRCGRTGIAHCNKKTAHPGGFFIEGGFQLFNKHFGCQCVAGIGDHFHDVYTCWYLRQVCNTGRKSSCADCAAGSIADGVELVAAILQADLNSRGTRLCVPYQVVASLGKGQ